MLTAEGLVKDYGKEQILRGISFSVHENSFTAILGPSGSGKSTLLNVLSGLIRPTSGTVTHDGKTITQLTPAQLADWKRRTVGSVFQNYLLLDNLTAEENIKVGICPNGQPLALDHLTRILEIDNILAKFPAQLSGGQQQRVAIARAVIKNPTLLFCDEATGSLDEMNSKKVVMLLHDLKHTFGITVLFVTHNEQIANTADRILTIKDGTLFKDAVNEKPTSADDMVWG